MIMMTMVVMLLMTSTAMLSLADRRTYRDGAMGSSSLRNR